MRIYEANRYYTLLALVVPLILLVPLLETGAPIEDGKLVGYFVLPFMAIIVAFAPFGFRLEVGSRCVRTLFFRLCLREIDARRVQSVTYGNLFRGGLGHGKGLKGWELVNGKHKYFSLGEKMYRKEAIEHARRILERKT